MDQRVEMTTPTTSAWAATASSELAAVSNMRMGWSPMPENTGKEDLSFIAHVRNILTRNRDCARRNRQPNTRVKMVSTCL